MITSDPGSNEALSPQDPDHEQDGSVQFPTLRGPVGKDPAEADRPHESPFGQRDLAVFIKTNKELQRVMLSDVLCLKADGNYVEIQMRTGRVILRNSMAEVLKSLPQGIFLLVNRSQAINVTLVDGVTSDEVSIGKLGFTLSRKYRDALLSKLYIVTGR